MKFTTLLLILQRQFITKWGRFFLASAGIMIGVWAITLTTSLSLGLSQTIIDAINSQPAAKVINVGRTEDGATDIFQLDGPPEYIGISKTELESYRDLSPYIEDIAINTTAANNFLNMALNTGPSVDGQTCFNTKNNGQNPFGENVQNLQNDELQISTTLPTEVAGEEAQSGENTNGESSFYDENCLELNFIDFVWANFYESNKSNWLGKKEKLNLDEIALCFNCNDLGERLGYENPEDLLGQNVSLEFISSPVNFKPGEPIDILNSTFGVQDIDASRKVEFTVASVIDDETNGGGFGAGSVYVDQLYFDEALKLGNPGLTDDQIGYFNFDIFVDEVRNVDEVFDTLEDEKLLAFSPIQILVQGVTIFFDVLTWFLSGFGFIAVVASVFGIVNVMTISVLERKKEIGVLKSLGSRNGDILRIFLLESASLGFIGWLFGLLVALGFGYGITTLFNIIVLGNNEWKNNLEAIGITSFSPDFPWWLILGTLVLAVVATSISGLIPAIRASRQNPVEVLRGE